MLRPGQPRRTITYSNSRASTNRSNFFVKRVDKPTDN
jgi:hypothetical protein